MQVVLGETAARLRVVPDAPRACGAAHQLGWHQPRALEGACCMLVHTTLPECVHDGMGAGALPCKA